MIAQHNKNQLKLRSYNTKHVKMSRSQALQCRQDQMFMMKSGYYVSWMRVLIANTVVRLTNRRKRG